MIVIADDITGAAEMAGIAFEQGRETRLRRESTGDCDKIATSQRADNEKKDRHAGCQDSCDNARHAGCAEGTTTVIATDTRSMGEEEAAAETRRLLRCLDLDGGAGRRLFKKTDSALRGHVVGELCAMMAATGLTRAVYLPANPSKGRIIRNGIYYINGTPIHETDFSFDPEFPARTSCLRQRFPDAEKKGIIMPDAESLNDIRQVIETYHDGHTLFAGAADLFTAFLSAEKPVSPLTPHLSPLTSHLSSLTSASVLILCGSTQSKPLDLGISIAPMPREVYDGEQGASAWLGMLEETWERDKRLILTIPHTHRTGKDIAVHLRTVMAEMTKRLVTRNCPEHLVIEGGATAWATLQALGWTNFTITAQLGPGVVQMSATNGTLVTLKPGSYPWGTILSSYKV